MGLADEKYMLFTTYRKDGRAVATPVWLAGLADGTIGFSTGPDTGKAKRIRHTPGVTMQACDGRGKNAHGEIYTGTARLVTGSELDRVNTAIAAKYGIMVPISRVVVTLAARLRGQKISPGSLGVVITLSDPPASGA